MELQIVNGITNFVTNLNYPIKGAAIAKTIDKNTFNLQRSATNIFADLKNRSI